MKTKQLAFTALMAAVTAVCSPLAIPLPFSSIPFTLGLFAVFLSGALLEKKYAFLAQLVYILLGAAGLPVFSGFRGGLGAVVGPTGGYLVVYPFMAFLIAWLAEKIGKAKWYCYYPGMILGLLLCYTLGSAWLAVVQRIGFAAALVVGVAPFVVFDVVKIVIASTLAFVINKILIKAGLDGM